MAVHLTRRDFNRQASSVGLSVATGAVVGGRNASSIAAAQTPFQLNYVLGSPMYGTEPLARVLAEAGKVGANTVDIWPRGHANHREQMDQLGFDHVAALLEQHSLRLGMITRYDLGPYRVTQEIPTLSRFGGKLLVCGAKAQPGDTLRQQVRSFCETMKPHVAQLEDAGITLGIENHANSLVSSPDSIKYFAEFATSPNFGLAMAPYHLPQDPKLIAELIRTLGPSLVFFQAWQHGKGCMKKLLKEDELLQLPGRGPLDFRPILAALKQINYTGGTEIFMHPVPRGIPILPDVTQVTAEINRSREYLQQCLV